MTFPKTRNTPVHCLFKRRERKITRDMRDTTVGDGGVGVKREIGPPPPIKKKENEMLSKETHIKEGD